MKNKLFNNCLILAAVTVLVVFAFYARVGATADAVVVLETSGMTCSACIKKITTALQSEKGVAATEVNLDAGLVIAGYDSKLVAPERLVKAVDSGGYQSRVARVLTPAQYKAMAGRDIGAGSAAGPGCGGCGPRGCGTGQQQFSPL